MENNRKLKIRLRPILDSSDSELVNDINEKLESNKNQFGEAYCPCSLVHTPDTICMCKDFRDKDEPGFCHCGKYEKYYEDNA